MQPNILSFPEVQSIVFCGDIHGDFIALVDMLRQKDIHDALIVIAGDCGFGFETPEYYEDTYQKILRHLQAYNLWIVMLRGNHDNPAYFNGDQRITYERWQTIPDYTILQACHHNILCVGGAISIDRSMRLQWMDIRPEREAYWIDEAPVYNPMALDSLSEQGVKIDTVVSHTAPSFCELQTKRGLSSWCMKDSALWNDTTQERQTMDAIHAHLLRDKHPLRHWYYGHFHQSWQSHIDGVNYTLLDIMELQELIN